MYLKRMTLQGFKSFGNKTEMQFQPGITAIVGPNGSGKSNTGDAIRWVLGEQSARSLRSAKMDDVIFGGSEFRKALGFAEVSLTLDNTDRTLPLDYVEVTITRRLFRSGESQYLINDTVCRLKDIHDLLADTGLGRDGYTLINQQDIETVLSIRPEDRRPLFEEAAGIVRYKIRKQEALRKLEETEQNLLRVNDILKELDNQVGPLEEQAVKAKAYREMADQLKYWETGLLGGKWREGQVLLEEQRKFLQLKQENLAEKAASLSRLDLETEEIKLWLTRADETLEEEQKGLLTLLTGLEKVEMELAVWSEKVLGWQEDIQRLQGDLIAREQELEGLKGRWLERQQEGESFQRQREEVDEVYLGQKEALSRLAAEQEALTAGIEEKKNDLIEVLNQLGEVRHSLKNLEENKNQGQRRQEMFHQQEKELRHSLTDVQTRKKAMEEELARISQQWGEMVARKQANQEQLKELGQQLRQEDEKRQQLVKSLEKARSRQTMLRELVEGHTGLYDGVKAVLTAAEKGQLTGIQGVVADLIRVPRELDTAMEVALGSGIQNVITTDESTAEKAIQYLKSTRAGRVTFLPLTLLTPQRLRQEEVQVLKGRYGDKFLGLAADLVQCEEKFRPAVDFLLGRTLVVTELPLAVRVARETGLRHPVVTRDGEIVRPGGAITGGQQARQRPSLLSQRSELESIDGLIRAEEVKMAEADRRGQELLNRIAAIQQEAEQLRQDERALELGKVGQERDLAAMAREEARLAAALDDLVQDAAAGAAAQENLEAERTRLEGFLAELTRKQETIVSQISEEEEKQKSLAQARLAMEQELTRTQIQMARLQQAESDLTQRITEAEEAYNRVLSGRNAVERQIEALHQRIQEAEEASRRGARQKEELSGVIRDKQTGLEGLKQERQARASRLSALEDEAKKFRDVAGTLREEVHALEMKVSRLEMEQDQIKRHLAEEYSLQPEDLPAGFTPEETEGAAKTIESLKRKIRALGSVNLEAIQEFENVKARHDFLQNQYKDLMEARESLFSILKEIEITTNQRFREAFEAIQVEFNALFRRLFGGGKAELELTDPANLSETGIEIFAQPPKKKPHHLLQLSSGEKTMTAIALLMAILKVKPAPFCVMDEVDAALDEANLNRFSEMLQIFSEKTQFLVVTHRRRTMETAETLYGITMEDSGVSKLVSVKMVEGETA